MAGICNLRPPVKRILRPPYGRWKHILHYIYAGYCISTCSSAGSGRLYAVSLQNGSAQLDFDSSNNVVSGGSTTVVPERADELGSGGIPVQVVPLGGGKVLVQGQEVGENIVDTGGQTSFKTYWHESYQ